MSCLRRRGRASRPPRRQRDAVTTCCSPAADMSEANDVMISVRRRRFRLALTDHLICRGRRIFPADSKRRRVGRRGPTPEFTCVGHDAGAVQQGGQGDRGAKFFSPNSLISLPSHTRAGSALRWRATSRGAIDVVDQRVDRAHAACRIRPRPPIRAKPRAHFSFRLVFEVVH
jgi:hypothetical protein